MSNIYPLTGPGRQVIPTEEDEKPVTNMNSFMFAHPMKHCRPKHLWPKNWTSIPDDEMKVTSIYLANFAEPIRTIADEVKCPACGQQVTGHHAIMNDWRYQQKLSWDPSTHEGRCESCAWPMRIRHKVMLGEAVIFFLPEFPLFYHPSATQRNLNA